MNLFKYLIQLKDKRRMCIILNTESKYWIYPEGSRRQAHQNHSADSCKLV